MSAPWSLDTKRVLTHYGVKDIKTGLTSEQVIANRERYGKNEIPPPEGTSLLLLILKQFEDKLVLILLGAAIISFVLALFEKGEDQATAFVEPAVILVILILNATVGVVQETNAEKAIEKLKESEAVDAVVIRDGHPPQKVPAASLVPGDIIIVADGDKVPADARILQISSAALQIEESALTGESDAVNKTSSVVEGDVTLNQDKRNMLFSGTLVVRGKCIAIVTSTGTMTELGKIATGLGGKKAAAAAKKIADKAAGETADTDKEEEKADEDDDDDDEEERTPLQKKLDEFGDQLSNVIGIICIVVWLINIGHFNDPVHGSFINGAIYYFKIAVALAVAAIPEGLPAVVTTCLALGTAKMARNGAIVRSLPSVETLGCTTVICSDKTGTLTTNKMSVQRVLVAVPPKRPGQRTAELATYTVTGDDWSPEGSICLGDNEDEELIYPAADVAALAEMGCIATLCTEATLCVDEQGNYSKTGPPTEAALLVLAEKIGVRDEAVVDSFASLPKHERCNAVARQWSQKYKRVATLEFTRQRKSMSVVVEDPTNHNQALLVKGAAERVIARCTHYFVGEALIRAITPAFRKELLARVDAMNAEGLRCLALAFRGLEKPLTQEELADTERYEGIESDLIFIGVAGMLDPPRPAVKDALARCRTAGIRVTVITGDNPLTAESIGRKIGLFEEDESLDGKSYTGEDINKMTPEELSEAVKTAALFSRVEPRHKLMIVEALKKQGEVVAMTGDGVNDATALQRADIGIAMGSGTSVAKEASKMILQDDNFATIVMAVQEGRAIYANTKQFIRYLISSNIGEVACIFGAAALGIPDALIPVQLLWVNLVTDGLPATALGFNPPDPDIMKCKPRSADERIVDRFMFIRYLLVGLYVGFGTLGGFIWWYLFAESGPKISFTQLRNFNSCTLQQDTLFAGVDCSIFSHPVPSTISLSVLVVIEMFNALNALSENQSLLTVTPLSNLWVIAAATLSMVLHLIIVYFPPAAAIFHVAPLNQEHWKAVLYFSLPVFFLDEALKFIARRRQPAVGTKAKAE